jgi:hypothetical protein
MDSITIKSPIGAPDRTYQWLPLTFAGRTQLGDEPTFFAFGERPSGLTHHLYQRIAAVCEIVAVRGELTVSYAK